MQVMDVTLTGGEIFTRPDLFVLIDGIISNQMRYSLLSNGTLIDEEMLSKLMVGKRRQRLDSVQVSIDGSRAEIHNQSRPRSFTRTVRGLRLLVKAGFPVTARVTINRHNLRDLEDIAGFLLEDIGLKAFSTNEAQPIGSGCRNDKETNLAPNEKAIAMEILDRLVKKYPGRLQASAGPQANKQMYAEMEHARQTGEKARRWKMGFLSACGCIFSQIAVLHDGSIVPCHMMSGLVLGNIQGASIGEIWRSHAVMAAMRRRAFVPMDQAPGCAGCEWTPFCNGGCPGLTYQLTDDFNRANPHDCYRSFTKGLVDDAIR
jgi:SynChlorMet cassette radical SAM/SPASM protein ScmE